MDTTNLAAAPPAPTQPAEPGHQQRAIDQRLRPFRSDMEEPHYGREDVPFTFADAVDIINPLQHLPVISSLYRAATGDAISGHARVLGGMLYGGASGMLTAAFDAVVEETTGRDMGQQVAALFTGAGDAAGPQYAEDRVQTAIADAPADAAAENPPTDNPPTDNPLADEARAAFTAGPGQALPPQILGQVDAAAASEPGFLAAGEVVYDGPSGRANGLAGAAPPASDAIAATNEPALAPSAFASRTDAPPRILGQVETPSAATQPPAAVQVAALPAFGLGFGPNGPLAPPSFAQVAAVARTPPVWQAAQSAAPAAGQPAVVAAGLEAVASGPSGRAAGLAAVGGGQPAADVLATRPQPTLMPARLANPAPASGVGAVQLAALPSDAPQPTALPALPTASETAGAEAVSPSLLPVLQAQAPLAAAKPGLPEPPQKAPARPLSERLLAADGGPFQRLPGAHR